MDSVWTDTLAEFREKAGGTDPVPAGVAISAVTASLALALVAKVLEITGRRKGFTGDRDSLDALLDAVRAESERLKQFADADIFAFNDYLERRRQDRELDEAARRTIEVPMNAARAAVRGLELCAEAAAMAQGLTAADIGAAAALLSGAVRAMLLSAGFNVRQLRSEDRFSAAIMDECRDLELEVLRRGDAIRSAIGARLLG